MHRNRSAKIVATLGPAGDSHRAAMPHLDIFAALQTGTDLLIDKRGFLKIESERLLNCY